MSYHSYFLKLVRERTWTFRAAFYFDFITTFFKGLEDDSLIKYLIYSGKAFYKPTFAKA